MKLNIVLNTVIKIWPLVRKFVTLSERCNHCSLPDTYTQITNGTCEECMKAIGETTTGEKVELSLTESRYTVLVSGGKDSSYLLWKLREINPDIKLTGIIVNNGFMSPIAIENAKFVCDKLKVDLIIVNSHIGEFKEKLKAAFKNLKHEGSYTAVDFVDGETIYDIGAEITKSLNINQMICGLTHVQLEKIKQTTSFQYEHNGVTVICPMACWQISEQEIFNTIKRYKLLFNSSSSPILTNNDFVIAMFAIDVINNGYCSFEPEFAQLVREKKADRKTWLHRYELLEFMCKHGLLNREIKRVLSKLDLQWKDVIN